MSDDDHGLHLSADDYLLRKVVHSSKLQRVIDWKTLGITKEYIDEQCRLKYSRLDDKLNFVDARVIDLSDSQDNLDRCFVTELCFPYNPPPDERDVFVYYNDLGPLCGDAGYLRIRDGYVYSQKIKVKS